MRALLLLCLAPTLAHADTRAAEQLENDGNWSACGQAYLDAYNVDPKGADADRALFGAGTCFMRSRSLGATVHALEMLRKSFPKSTWTVRAYQPLAMTYDVVGKWAEATAVREELAAKFPAEPEAADELRNAITFRIALGENAKALDDGKRWLKAYAAKQDNVAPQVALQLAEAQGANEGKWLDEVIHKYKLRDADMLHAMVRQAELAWMASCKGKELCISMLPVDKLPRCVSAERIRVDRRAGGDAAQALFAKAKSFYEAKLSTDKFARTDGALAMLRLADAKLEAYLAIGGPGVLDFSPENKAVKEASVKRFDDWIKKLTKDGGDTTRLYEAILALKDPDASVASAERLAIVTHGMALLLSTLEIPKDVRTGEFAKEKQEAFCDRMKEVAEPLQKRADEAFEVCASKAVELGSEVPGVQRCRKQLGKVEPVLPPLHATPPAPQFPAPAARYAGQTGCAKVAITDDESQYYAGLVAVRCKGDARAIWSKAGTAKARAALGVLAWQHGDATTAIGEWKQAIAQDGKLAAAYYGLGVANNDVEALTNANAAGEPNGGVALAMLAAKGGHIGAARLWVMHLPEEQKRAAVAVIAAAEGKWMLAAGALDGYDGALAALHLHQPDVALQKLGAAKPYDELIAHGAAQLMLKKTDDARKDFEAAKALDPTRTEAQQNLELIK